jgi:hypothetical protein
MSLSSGVIIDIDEDDEEEGERERFSEKQSIFFLSVLYCAAPWSIIVRNLLLCRLSERRTAQVAFIRANSSSSFSLWSTTLGWLWSSCSLASLDSMPFPTAVCFVTSDEWLSHLGDRGAGYRRRYLD